MDSHARSVAKAITWQITGLFIMALIGVAFTGSLTAGGLLAAITTVIGFVSYLIHERIWARIGWGRVGAGTLSPAPAPTPR